MKKKQHYIPKAYLQFFSFLDKDKKKRIYASPLSRNLDEIQIGEENLLSPILDNIGHCHYLYEHKYEVHGMDGKFFYAANEIEDSFIEMEGEYASICTKIIEAISLLNPLDISPEEVETLKIFMASLEFRHPIFIKISNFLSNKTFSENPQILNQLKEGMEDIDNSVFSAAFAHHNLSKFINVNDFGIAVRAMKRTMDNSKMCILKTLETDFITSDTPVSNIYGEKNGIEYDLLGMPISSKLFLAFVDTQAKIPLLLDIDTETTKKINDYQFKNATRFLFAQKKETLLGMTARRLEVEPIQFDSETMGRYHKMMDEINW